MNRTIFYLLLVGTVSAGLFDGVDPYPDCDYKNNNQKYSSNPDESVITENKQSFQECLQACASHVNPHKPGKVCKYVSWHVADKWCKLTYSLLGPEFINTNHYGVDDGYQSAPLTCLTPPKRCGYKFDGTEVTRCSNNYCVWNPNLSNDPLDWTLVNPLEQSALSTSPTEYLQLVDDGIKYSLNHVDYFWPCSCSCANPGYGV